jgi:hypothetical protein
MSNSLQKDRQKICNLCGNDCEVWSIDRNAIICKDCKPIPKVPKKIPNEAQMIQKIIGGTK